MCAPRVRPRKDTYSILHYAILRLRSRRRGNVQNLAIQSLLSASYSEILMALDTHGDGVIPGGVFGFLGLATFPYTQ